MMDSDSSSVISTSDSVDKEIVIHLERLKQIRKQSENFVYNERKEQFEIFTTNNIDEIPFNLQGIHFYTFNHLKIKFGFNPSEVAHVTRKIKFLCILKYTGSFWSLGRNTIPANWKPRICEIFFKGKSVKDSNIIEAIEEIHSIFVEWSINHEKFRKNKIQRYRAGEIEFFDLDSEDEELHMDQEERNQLELRRERILKRMISPKRRKPPKRKQQQEITSKRRFEMSPNIHLDSD